MALTPMDIFSAAFSTIEVRTTATPPMVINMRGPPSPSTQALMNELRPTIILSGPAGRFVIAPAGEAAQQLDFSSSAWKLGLGVGAALLGIALFGAALSK